jgi:transcriptional regulator with XRE-family HTH domain
MFSERIRAIRESKQLSQTAFGKLIGFSKPQILRWEAGTSQPHADTLKEIAEKLGVTTAYLLGLAEEPTGHVDESSLTPIEQLLIATQRFRDAHTALERAIDRVVSENAR